MSGHQRAATSTSPGRSSRRQATLVTIQLPLEHWQQVVGDATFGDAILDRLVHHAHTLSRKGPFMRRKKPGKEDASPDHLA